MSFRAIGRLARASSRTSHNAFRSATVTRPRFACAFGKPMVPVTSHSVFSTTSYLKANEELVAKLESEVSIGKEEQEQQEQDFGRSIKEFLDNTEFKLEDTPGQEEVVLSRTYNDEIIKVVFSIADFGAQDPDVENDLDDPAMYDEEDVEALNAQSGGANTKGSVAHGRTKGGNIQVGPEDDPTPGAREELRNDEDQDLSEPGFPANVQVHVTRPGKGGLTFSCIAEEGNLHITDVYYFPKADMAEAKTPEADLARRSLYTGPPFGNLDDSLQEIFEGYLEERGVNEQMAVFIPDYIDVKEQSEYIRWLDNVKSFVE